MAIKLQLTAKGSDGTKTFTIPNPKPKEEFDGEAAEAFVATWANEYGVNVGLVSAKYITTIEEEVYPEP